MLTHTQPRPDNAYIRTHAPIAKGDAHCALVLALFPFLPPGDKSAIRIGALSCMSSFLSFFLSLEGFFLCGEFDGGQTGMRVCLDTIPCSSTVRAYPAGMKSLKGVRTTPGEGGGNGGSRFSCVGLLHVKLQVADPSRIRIHGLQLVCLVCDTATDQFDFLTNGGGNGLVCSSPASPIVRVNRERRRG